MRSIAKCWIGAKAGASGCGSPTSSTGNCNAWRREIFCSTPIADIRGGRWSFAGPWNPCSAGVRHENGGVLPGVYVPRHGPNRKWTKHECFVAMQCDSEAYWRQPQIQATFSVWQKCALAESFAAEWLRWCLQPLALSDEKLRPDIREYPEFIDHRYDQSILTNLALTHGIRCFGAADEIHSETKYIDNLSDRIAGRPWRIYARNLSRRIVSETKKHWSQLRLAETLR